jgi:hypothetical protein
MTTAPELVLTPAQAMTLAAIAPTGATPRPSGETLADQTTRIMTGVSGLLADTTLATRGTWELVWLALSPDNANMAYLARNTDGSNQLAVVIRGTIGNLTDFLEDLDVGTVVPFTTDASSPPAAISKGAMAGFTQIVTMRPPAGPGTPSQNLVEALAAALDSSPPQPQPAVYVIGHSLGGCLATVVATYLHAQTWNTAATPQFGVLTFAAPTAGLQSFADRFGSVPWIVSDHYANAYDLVPLAWTDLPAATDWYPNAGPKATPKVKELIKVIAGFSNGHTYVQPGKTTTLNGTYQTFDPALTHHTTADFMGQVGFQHANSTYLGLLGAPLVPAGPAVTSVMDTSGAGGDSVAINGSGFTWDSVVDFGPIPCTQYRIESDTQITATVPAGAGIVDVVVTNTIGSSPAIPFCQFAYGGPEPLVVTDVQPNTGSSGTVVTISGWGFRGRPLVRFGDKPAEIAGLFLPGQILAVAPERDLAADRTVDITVTVDEFTAPTSPADEYTYPPLL